MFGFDVFGCVIGCIVGKDGKMKFVIENVIKICVVFVGLRVYIFGVFENIGMVCERYVVFVLFF